jgi:hypothetical protein
MSAPVKIEDVEVVENPFTCYYAQLLHQGNMLQDLVIKFIIFYNNILMVHVGTNGYISTSFCG